MGTCTSNAAISTSSFGIRYHRKEPKPPVEFIRIPDIHGRFEYQRNTSKGALEHWEPLWHPSPFIIDHLDNDDMNDCCATTAWKEGSFSKLYLVKHRQLRNLTEEHCCYEELSEPNLQMHEQQLHLKGRTDTESTEITDHGDALDTSCSSSYTVHSSHHHHHHHHPTAAYGNDTLALHHLHPPHVSSYCTTNMCPTMTTQGQIRVLKSIPKHFINAFLLDQLRNEINIMSHYDHPNIVKIHEAYERDSAIDFIMDYNHFHSHHDGGRSRTNFFPQMDYPNDYTWTNHHHHHHNDDDRCCHANNATSTTTCHCTQDNQAPQNLSRFYTNHYSSTTVASSPPPSPLLTEEQVGIIICKLLSAVDYLHDFNVVHGDLSLQHVMLVHDEEDDNKSNHTEEDCDDTKDDINDDDNINMTTKVDLRIIDFGFSKRYGHVMDNNAKMTVENMYAMSPQSLQGLYDDYKCDIWSIGVMAYMLLSNTIPWHMDDDDDHQNINPTIPTTGDRSTTNDLLVRQHSKDGNAVPTTTHLNSSATPEQLMMHRILQGAYKPMTAGPVWNTVSEDAKTWIAKMLLVNPYKRPTAAEILRSKWLRPFKRTPLCILKPGVANRVLMLSTVSPVAASQQDEKPQEEYMANTVTRTLMTKDNNYHYDATATANAIVGNRDSNQDVALAIQFDTNSPYLDERISSSNKFASIKTTSCEPLYDRKLLVGDSMNASLIQAQSVVMNGSDREQDHQEVFEERQDELKQEQDKRKQHEEIEYMRDGEEIEYKREEEPIEDELQNKRENDQIEDERNKRREEDNRDETQLQQQKPVLVNPKNVILPGGQNDPSEPHPIYIYDETIQGVRFYTQEDCDKVLEWRFLLDL